MSRFIGRPSPAMIVAFLALVLAVVGTSIAAVGRNSVGADELGRVTARSNSDSINPGISPRGAASVKCRRGEQRLGGGATLPNADPLSDDPPSVEQNGPKGKRGWRAVAHSDNDPVTLRVTVLCLEE